MVDHAGFWVVIGTVAPLAIASDVVLLGQSIGLSHLLKRQDHETSRTSWLRQRHLSFIGFDLGGCLVVIGLCLYALWSNEDNTWLAALAAFLLFSVLIGLCVLAVCTATIKRQKGLLRQGLSAGATSQ